MTIAVEQRIIIIKCLDKIKNQAYFYLDKKKKTNDVYYFNTFYICHLSDSSL